MTTAHEKGYSMAIQDRKGGDAAQGEQPRFEVRDVVSAGMHTLALSGELDMAAAGELETVIVACAESASGLTLDLSQLTFMDSTGVRLLLFAQQACQANEAEFAVIPGPRQVQRVFEVTDLVKHLPFREPTD